MKYFRIKIGFEPNDYISIDETEYESAVKAQITGKVCITKEGTISGNNIISIKPDWNRVMGFKPDYQLVGEDWDYIGKKRVDEYRSFEHFINTNVQRKLEGLPAITALPEQKKNLGNGFKGIGDIMGK
jgi:hypothetical protein